jgi:hypothetical protein
MKPKITGMKKLSLTLTLRMWREYGELPIIPVDGRWDLTWRLKG